MNRVISIVILTDNVLFGECLASKLEVDQEFAVKDIIYYLDEALKLIRDCQPELILVDSQLHNALAVPFIKQLTREIPHTRTLLLGVIASQTDIQAYIEAGVTGYLGNDTIFSELKKAIELVVHGEAAGLLDVSHVLSSHLVAFADAPEQDLDHLQEPTALTARELEIVNLIADGWNNRQIADQLCLSPHTVKNHVYNILKKLRVQRRFEAVKYASEQGWLSRRYP